jgi:hypothetical protein
MIANEVTMAKNHPITPSPELVQQWVDTYFGGRISQSNFHLDLATRAAQWGADQELEACCELLQQKDVPAWSLLRMHRRPKPPSLKEQALALLDPSLTYGSITREDEYRISVAKAEIIRRALEQIPEDK